MKMIASLQGETCPLINVHATVPPMAARGKCCHITSFVVTSGWTQCVSFFLRGESITVILIQL